MLPPKTRPEWKELLRPDDTTQFSCFPLQMKATRLKRELGEDKLTMDEAVNQLHELCEKYSRAVKEDMTKIFGNN